MIKLLQYLIIKDVQATEAFNPQREFLALQNMKFLHLFLFFVGHFCPPGSGS